MKKKVLVLGIVFSFMANLVQAGYGIDYDAVEAHKSSRLTQRQKRSLKLAQRKANKSQIAADKKYQEEQRKLEKKQAEEIKKARKEAERAEKKRDKELRAATEKREKELKKQKKEQDRKLAKQREDAERAEKRRVRAARKAREKTEKDAKTAARRLKEKERKEMEKRTGKWDFLYLTPAWEFPAIPYREKDLATVAAGYNEATKAYSSSDHGQDITKLAFGEKTISVKEILLASKVIKDGYAEAINEADPRDLFLYYLADDSISFDGSQSTWWMSLDLARHLTKDISVGFQIPLAGLRQKLDLQTNVSSASQTKMTAGSGQFPSAYDGSFTAFIDDILEKKGIERTTRNTMYSLGNVSVFANFAIKSKHLESFMAGLEFVFPTPRDRNVNRLWSAVIGKEFSELSAYVAMLYKTKCSVFNPHLYLKGSYVIPAKVDRRVPRVRAYDGTDSAGTAFTAVTQTDFNDLPFFNELQTKANGALSTEFTERDTTIREFSTDTKNVKMNTGAIINLRVGNMFQNFITKRGTLDIFYDLVAAGKDYVGSNLDTVNWDGSILTENSFYVHNKIGLNLCYQFDSHFRWELAGLYTFAGRNVPELWEVNTHFRWDF